MAKKKGEKLTFNKRWDLIFDYFQLSDFDFGEKSFSLPDKEELSLAIGERVELRTLCYQTSREKRPEVFKKYGLFLLPVSNGQYVILKGEGYVDIPDIIEEPLPYISKLDFDLDTSLVGHSEMQHLDYAYATSLIRTFLEDDSLNLTIRGRKYTPEFDFFVGPTHIEVKSVQTEIDAGYEGREQIVLVEAKQSIESNVIIRQLYYPFRQWQQYSNKPVKTVFFTRKDDVFFLWEFQFQDVMDYNSIRLLKSRSYVIRV